MVKSNGTVYKSIQVKVGISSYDEMTSHQMRMSVIDLVITIEPVYTEGSRVKNGVLGMNRAGAEEFEIVLCVSIVVMYGSGKNVVVYWDIIVEKDNRGI